LTISNIVVFFSITTTQEGTNTMTTAVHPRIDDFTRAYVECALWSTTDESTPAGGEPMDANYSLNDIDVDTLTRMAEDCARFQAENAADLELYDHPRWTAAELGGHDLWLTRNGHGCGFWDRDSLPADAGERLTDAAHKLGEFYLSVGDNGKIYG
jgi:hypothetical protein